MHHAMITITIYPICKETDTGSLMVFCESYKQWFHKECVPPFGENDDDYQQKFMITLSQR